jgi:hypothetical protein
MADPQAKASIPAMSFHARLRIAVLAAIAAPLLLMGGCTRAESNAGSPRYGAPSMTDFHGAGMPFSESKQAVWADLHE